MKIVNVYCFTTTRFNYCLLTMQSFANPKVLYRRIAKWVGKKIRFMGSQYKLSYMDFDDREIIYEWVRKKDRWIHIYHIDRKKDRKNMFQVSFEDKDEIYLEGYWPEQIHHEALKNKIYPLEKSDEMNVW